MNSGYLYAVDLGNGEVKIGMTKHHKTRPYIYHKMGYDVQSVYVTPFMLKEARDAEREICVALSEYLANRREYFKCDMDLAMKHLGSVYSKSTRATPDQYAGKKFPLHIPDIGARRKDKLKRIAKIRDKSYSNMVRDWIDGLKEK